MNNQKNTRVLIAEDDYLVAERIEEVVETIGYQVVGKATDGPTTVQMTEALRPDVILMDLEMPDMDGIEATRRINDSCPTPVVVLTAHEMPELLKRASAAGVGAYLLKPPNARQMERAITIAVGRFEDMMELRRLNEEIQERENALRESNRHLEETLAELSETQERMVRQERLAAVGQLAGGMAHDFNNLLTAINGFAELIRYQLPPDDPTYNMAGSILRSGQRAAYLVSQLLGFAGKQMIMPQMLNPNEIVTEMDQTLRQAIGDDIQMAVNLAPDLWPVNLDPKQLKQVISDLTANARRAMPDGGRLTIETANVALGEEQIAEHLEVTEGDYMLLAVSDTGDGMSQEAIEHIFEPFFVTSQDVADGIGLRMAAVYGVVKQNRGYIWVESEAGQGTTFKTYLPRATENG